MQVTNALLNWQSYIKNQTADAIRKKASRISSGALRSLNDYKTQRFSILGNKVQESYRRQLLLRHNATSTSVTSQLCVYGAVPSADGWTGLRRMDRFRKAPKHDIEHSHCENNAGSKTKAIKFRFLELGESQFHGYPRMWCGVLIAAPPRNLLCLPVSPPYKPAC